MGEAKRRKQLDPTYGKVYRGIPNRRSDVVEKQQPCPMTTELSKELKQRTQWGIELTLSDSDAVCFCDLEYEQVDSLNYPIFGFCRLDAGERCVALGYVSGACPEDYLDCPDGLSFTWFPSDYALFWQLWTPSVRAPLVHHLTEVHSGAARYTARYCRRQSA